MRALSALLVIAATIQVSLSSQNSFYVKYSPPGSDPERQSSFYELPRTLTTTDGWALDEDRLATDGVAVYCRNKDYDVCVLYDRKGSVAGIQVSMAAADVDRTHAPARKQIAEKTVAGTDVYSATAYFVDPSVLTAGGRDLDATTKTAPNGIYVPNPAGGLRRAPLTENEIQQQTKYVKQACIPNMGRHYMYNVSKQSNCEDLEAFFVLYDEKTHELAGVGLIFLGEATVTKGGRPWFEHPGKEITTVVSPDSPDCITALSNQHGLTSLHIYVTEQPWTLTC